jgi:hypothetical protein
VVVVVEYLTPMALQGQVVQVEGVMLQRLVAQVGMAVQILVVAAAVVVILVVLAHKAAAMVDQE